MKRLPSPGQHNLLYFLAGALVLSLLSTVQKVIIAAPVTVDGFLVPVIYGGVTGSLLGVWAERLKTQNRRLQELIVARQWMLRDLHHRIQNNLQVVSSVLDLELAGCNDCAGGGAAGSASRLRIDLLAGIHQVLYELNAQYEVDLRDLLERHLRAVYGRFCGGVVDGMTPSASRDRLKGDVDGTGASDSGRIKTPDTLAAAPLEVPLDTAVVVTMIVNEMIAECEGYWNCELESSLSVACSGDRGRCEVRVHLPAAVVNRVPDYDADSDRILFRDTLVRALADQIGAEATITWQPELSGTISFAPDEQRRYEKAAVGAPVGGPAATGGADHPTARGMIPRRRSAAHHGEAAR
jgi:hypothetical protein